MFERMLIAGYGRMASALLEGWLAAGIPADRFEVFNPRAKPVPPGVEFTTTVPDTPFEAVMLGFKPQMLEDAIAPLSDAISPDTTVLSLLAGLTVAQLQQTIPAAGAHVRFMPNLAAAIGKSPVALFGAGLTDDRRFSVKELAEASGTAVWLEDEEQFDLVTALAGSGPAFVYRFIDALASGACELGLPSDQAQQLALQMVEGAASLAARSDVSPADLADRVASPGGMTREGLNVLDRERALQRLLTDTLEATRDRGAYLARSSKNG